MHIGRRYIDNKLEEKMDLRIILSKDFLKYIPAPIRIQWVFVEWVNEVLSKVDCGHFRIVGNKIMEES